MAKRNAKRKDVFNIFSTKTYKTIPQVRREIEGRRLEPGPYLREGIYNLLPIWVEEGILEAKKRSVEDHIKKDGYVFAVTEDEEFIQVSALPLPEGVTPHCLTEYRKVEGSNIYESTGGLELLTA